MIQQFSNTVASNAAAIKLDLIDHRNTIDRRIEGIQEVTQLILKSHGDMKEDLGYIKGRLEKP
jgi:hypothetical protein